VRGRGIVSGGAEVTVERVSSRSRRVTARHEGHAGAKLRKPGIDGESEIRLEEWGRFPEGRLTG
jgi:hypothetical protein